MIEAVAIIAIGNAMHYS